VRVLPLRPEHVGAAGQLAEGLRDQGIRADVDPRDGGLSRRVALAHADEVPFVLVLGQTELEGDFVDVRSREGRREIPRGELPSRLAEALRPPV
jgi:threonyl-tRNA synthetase